MKKTLLAMVFLTVGSAVCLVQGQGFDQWFEDGIMRIDLVFSGTATETNYALEGVKREPHYSGPRKDWLDEFDYGDHQFKVRDAASGRLIFSYSYCTLFKEWQTTSEAGSVQRAYSHVLRFPWPRQEVVVEVHDRNKKGEMVLNWKGSFDPSTVYADPQIPMEFPTVNIQIKGKSEEKVDLLFLAEGYTADEMDKFEEDVRRSMDYIFSEEPFASRRKDFNVRAVLSASPESGTDIPGKGVWKKTVVNSSFYTFGIERYMTTPDFKAVSDVAANAPYDALYILVNTEKYGGGGIYNFYSISAADNAASRAVVIHEFGHSFAGLADEYYNSSVAYNDFFPLDVEPWAPNLTTLVDFPSKWKSMLAPSTPVPTIARAENSDLLGVYEGGGYVAKGVFRPKMDCIMHSNDAVFCPVCSKSIEAMIDRHTR